MRTRQNTAILVLLLVAFWGGTGIASAHFLTEDSVDGSEIRYEDNTKYNGALDNAIERWEALPGGVSIAPDSFSTVTDLEVKDYEDNDGSCGYWDGRSGADLINMNKFYMEGYGTTNRYACMIHEWGHAHRLAHSYNTEVMDDCPVSNCGSTYTTPQSHDKSDYDQQW